MDLPVSPLLHISSLMKALISVPSDGLMWSGSEPEFITHFYWQGRQALAAGINVFRKANNAASIVVWAPDYFCNEALENVRLLPAKINFYPVNQDLTPNWSELEGLVKPRTEGQVFILVHYFGFPNAVGPARIFCRQHGMLLLEDGAHLLRPYGGMERGDMLIFSPRKMLPVPSCGILVLPKNWDTFLDSEPSYPAAGKTLPWICLRLAQTILVRARIPSHRFRRQAVKQLRPPTELTDSMPTLKSYDPFTLKLLRVMESRFDDITQKLRRNYLQLTDWVDGISLARPFVVLSSNEICPHAFPLFIEQNPQKILSSLQAAGIPARQWPIFPPEVLKDQTSHAVALRTNKHLVLLPVHQSLSLDQVDLMGKRLRQILLKN